MSERFEEYIWRWSCGHETQNSNGYPIDYTSATIADSPKSPPQSEICPRCHHERLMKRVTAIREHLRNLKNFHRTQSISLAVLDMSSALENCRISGGDSSGSMSAAAPEMITMETRPERIGEVITKRMMDDICESGGGSGDLLGKAEKALSYLDMLMMMLDSWLESSHQLFVQLLIQILKNTVKETTVEIRQMIETEEFARSFEWQMTLGN
ncbi:hypothetical protein F5Y16DRAFT_399238 [Xylariaceae sp. FL0255]|nr:hypothetical protein F5Y16DRAFT_399238 [Xylariaceae sp. FL0255]